MRVSTAQDNPCFLLPSLSFFVLMLIVDNLLEAGEFSIDLYTMPDSLTNKLWEFFVSRLIPPAGLEPGALYVLWRYADNILNSPSGGSSLRTRTNGTPTKKCHMSTSRECWHGLGTNGERAATTIGRRDSAYDFEWRTCFQRPDVFTRTHQTIRHVLHASFETRRNKRGEKGATRKKELVL